jgi:hypothetical protein
LGFVEGDGSFFYRRKGGHLFFVLAPKSNEAKGEERGTRELVPSPLALLKAILHQLPNLAQSTKSEHLLVNSVSPVIISYDVKRDL